MNLKCEVNLPQAKAKLAHGRARGRVKFAAKKRINRVLTSVNMLTPPKRVVAILDFLRLFSIFCVPADVVFAENSIFILRK